MAVELGDLGRDAPEHRARGGEGDLLADHRAQQGLGWVEPSRQTDARHSGDEGREPGIPGQRLVDRGRVGVQIEPAAHARRERPDILQRGERRRAAHAGAFVVETHVHLRESAGQAHPALDADVGDPFDARHGVVGEVAQHAHAVEGCASGEAQGDGRAGTDSALRRRRGATLATREGAQCARGQVVDLPHGVVELPDAAEPARERHLRGGQLGAGEQRAGRFRAVRAGESEGAGAEFRRHDAREMPRAVAEVRGETRHAVALDHPAIGKFDTISIRLIGMGHVPHPGDGQRGVGKGEAHDRVELGSEMMLHVIRQTSFGLAILEDGRVLGEERAHCLRVARFKSDRP